MLDVNIKGLADLEKVLKEVAPKLERNILRAGLLAGSKVIAAEAQKIVRAEAYDSGDLYESIRASTYGKYRRLGGLPAATIKAGGPIKAKGGRAKSRPFYAHIIEWGAKPHVIRAKSAKGLRVGDRRLLQVNHPGVQGIRFMTRAADTQAQAAVRAFAEKVRERLQKEGLDVPAPIAAEDFDNEG